VNKFQERTIYISLGVFVFFLAISMITSNLGFIIWSLPPIFLSLMLAFFAKNNKYIQRFNQKHTEKPNLQ